MRSKPAHAPMDKFQVVDNCLCVGGKPIPQIAETMGRTPFYVYDASLMTDRVNHLRAVLPPAVHLHYAMKANPMPAVVNHLAALVDGLDVASAGELKVALASNTEPHNISFAGPGKTDSELEVAASAGITINLESNGELQRLANIGERLGIQPVVAVRVNPDFDLKASGMKMSGGPKPFGIDAEVVPETLGMIKDRDLKFRGFHIFSGSQNLRSDALVEAQTKTLELALRLAEAAPNPIDLLNIGGGFGIPYFPGEAELDLQPVADNLANRLPGALNRLGHPEVVIELGRYFVGEAGLYICKIIDKKVSRGHTYLITDGGLHHHLAASGNFGQVIRKNFPVAIANRVTASTVENVSVVGPLCTPLDILGDNMPLPVAEPGDLVAVYQSGAYGLTASPRNFLSHPDAQELFV